MLTAADFAARAETFGLDKGPSWALSAFRLVFQAPRVYAPLVDAWEHRFPGTRAALDRLVASGFVAFQPPVLVDTRTGLPAARATAPVARYRTTARGRRLLSDFAEDSRALEDAFPKAGAENLPGVVRLLEECSVTGGDAEVGLSCPFASELSGLDERAGRWWVTHLTRHGYLRRLPGLVSDVREVIPAHWRVTRLLCRQLDLALGAFSADADALRYEFRLRRSKFLGDIDSARVGVAGATDFDHDVRTQEVIAGLVRSPQVLAGGILAVEPRFFLPTDTTVHPWEFRPSGARRTFYQPDAELRSRARTGGVARVAVEYERRQSRRDAWAHVERFLGWVATHASPTEPVELRFVVEGGRRKTSYSELIEAFADYVYTYPERGVPNPTVLAVGRAEELLAAEDALHPTLWREVTLPNGGADTERRPALHRVGDPQGPYATYFSRENQ